MYTILIADDDDKLRQLVRRILELDGHKIIECSSGAAAIEAFKITTPDLAILDINMGVGANGYEVCKYIRGDSFGASIPVIFLTGMNKEEDLIQGFQEGADDYIKKPFSLPEFKARVKAQLERLKRQTRTITQLGDKQFKIGSEIEGEKDNYIISSRLSSGGMGVIFRGSRLSDKLEVVIKTLNSSFVDNYKDIQRFLREANITISSSHPNVAQGIEIVRTAEHCFYVMRYVQGESLDIKLEKEKYIHIKDCLNIIKQITTGLQHLHSLSLIHRDIKPGNILVDSNNTAILVDMGLTKTANSQPDLTTEGVILGTPYYLSPEQAMGEILDIRSDIYSLGATFYHCATGNVPFRGSSTLAIINARFLGEPISPKETIPEIPDEVSHIISKMMARNPKNRYQTPTDLLQALERIHI